MSCQIVNYSTLWQYAPVISYLTIGYIYLYPALPLPCSGTVVAEK